MEVANNLSYTSAQLSTPLIGLTLHQLLEQRVSEHPDREMYVYMEDNERITFKEFKDRVENLAAGLLSMGMKKGDRLAMLSNIHMEFVLCVAAARSIGVVRIRPTFPNSTVQDILLRSKAKAILLGRSPSNLHNRLNDIRPSADKNSRFPNLDIVIGVGVNNKSGTYSICEIEELGSDPNCRECFNQMKNDVKFDDDSDIFCTSGSTGYPKLAVHTHFSIINGSKAFLCYIDSMPDKANRKFLSRTSSHITGEITGVTPPMVAGVTSVLPSPAYSIQTTLQTIQNERCTDAIFIINELYDILNYTDIDKYDISSLSACFVGGSNIPFQMVDSFQRKHANAKISIVYGSTETVVMTSSMPWDPVENRYSTGKPLPNIEIQVVDNDGKCLPLGSVGEVWCRCPGKFKEYLGNEERTQDVVSPRGWLKTGDLGVLDKSGCLTVVGRTQDVINKAAAKILPAPIENILSQHPSINQVQVLGVPDERLCDEVCICIRPTDGMTVDREQIVAYLTGKVREECLSGYVLIFDHFPITDVGKIDRKTLTKQAVHRIKS